jgi:hypothetical protein
VRKLLTAALAASLGICGGGQAWGQEASKPASNGREPGRLQINKIGVAVAINAATNQSLADAIALKLNQSPLLKNFRVTISVQDGEADLAGAVLTQAQRAEVLRVARSVPGVEQVRDRLHVNAGTDVVQAQASPPTEPLGSTPLLAVPPQAKPPAPNPGGGLPTRPLFPPMPSTGPGGPPAAGGILEPLPLQGAPPGFPSAAQPPPMPPNAWPTYAPYNNFSRVAYPNIYPYESFPFIGPFYPFPKVPLGWRSVTLQWQDGNWWIGRNATGHDWWRVRYW